MALADPQSVTVSGNAKSLPRIGQALSEGTFQTADGEFGLIVKHDASRRTRHITKLTRSLIVADPLFPTQNQTVSYSAHLVIDVPKNGVVAADVVALANALVAWATSGTITKVVGGES